MASAESVAPNQEGALATMFDALTVPDVRRRWTGSLLSNIGTWMQLIGSGWLVRQFTHSAFWLGIVSFTSAVPILVLSLFAGVIADRVGRRRLLLITQSSVGALAFALALLVTLHRVNIVLILVITALTATAMAFNMPAWQAMIPDLCASFLKCGRQMETRFGGAASLLVSTRRCHTA